MSKPSPPESSIQGQRQQQQKQYPDRRYDAMRRSSEPNISVPQSVMNVGFAAGRQPPQAPLGFARSTQHVAPQPQNSIQRQHHSFSSSMDLISPASSTTGHDARGSSAIQPVQSNLFKSSSHHTSHTAAAGDLLTMSRRALYPPQSSQSNAIARKRSATMANGTNDSSNTGQLDVMSMNGTNSHISGQHQTNSLNSQQHIHAPQHSHLMDQSRGVFPNDAQGKVHFNDQAASPTGIPPPTYVSSSTIGSAGDNDESYQQHRTIRRCRRSDSFDMMEDC